MPKARVIVAVNFRQEDIPNYEKVQEILQREGKSYSEHVREQDAQFIKAHGSGNPQYTLDKNVVAYPTAWDKEAFILHDYTDSDLKEMLTLLEQHAREVREVMHYRAAKAAEKPKERLLCPHCGRPIFVPFTLEDHYYSHPECRDAAKKKEASA